MTMYVTREGEKFVAKNATELVGILHMASLAPAKSDAAFMKDMAARVRLQTGKAVRVGSAEQFVRDLLSAGAIRVVDPDDEVEAEDE